MPKSASFSEEQLQQFGIAVVGDEAVPVKNGTPDDTWSLNQLAVYASGQITESVLQSHKSAIALFRAGRALAFARTRCKAQGHGVWADWKRRHGLADTTANDAIRLYEGAGTEEALTGMGITEAKQQFVYPANDDPATPSTYENASDSPKPKRVASRRRAGADPKKTGQPAIWRSIDDPPTLKRCRPALHDGATFDIRHGDCLDVLPTIPDQSVDAVITDPPYPEINRSYGTLTESQWHTLMDGVVKEARRVLRPKGSAVFVLQPNYDKIGRMRLWLWKFLVRTAEKWNLIQNVYWWNYTTPALAGANRRDGLLRNSVKYMLWFGSPDCYRAQDAVLWEPAKFDPKKLENRALKYGPSGQSRRDGRSYATAQERGGSVPFNLLPLSATHGGTNNSSAYGHGAGTPLPLAEWWTRYITKPGDTILDPFNGVGTMGVAALSQGRKYVGIEQSEEWCHVSRQRLADAPALAV